MKYSQASRSKDYRKIDQFTDLDAVRDSFNELITELNYVLKNSSLEASFNACFLRGITIPANTTKRFAHTLGILPKYRIILRQEGNAVIEDVYSEWNDAYVTFKNSGAVDIVATIMILKE